MNTQNAMLRRYLCAGLVIALLGSLQPMLAGAQEFPSKPIQMIVPYAPGGSTDIIGRMAAEIMTTELGQQVIVVNKPGANCAIGSSYVALAPADGYTILFATDALLILNPLLYKKLSYQPEQDFTPIGVLVNVPQAMMVLPSMPIKNVGELVSYAKKNPNRLTFGSSGLGGNGHLAGELFMQELGVEMTHVPYKGGSQSLIGLLSGEVNVLIGVVGNFMEHVKAGKMRPLAVTTRERASVWPDVPTIAESGGTVYDATLVYGVWAPRKTPPKIIEVLNRALNKALTTPAFRGRLENLGYIVFKPQEPSYYGKLVEQDRKKWGALIKAKKISLD